MSMTTVTQTASTSHRSSHDRVGAFIDTPGGDHVIVYPTHRRRRRVVELSIGDDHSSAGVILGLGQVDQLIAALTADRKYLRSELA